MKQNYFWVADLKLGADAVGKAEVTKWLLTVTMFKRNDRVKVSLMEQIGRPSVKAKQSDAF